MYHPRKILYSLTVADLQQVALEELGRELKQGEIKQIDDRLGDFIGWYDAISMAIQAVGISNEETTSAIP